MRIKSQWFKGDREKTPEEIAGAMAFTIWRIADNALKNTRKANFEISIGLQYFLFLSEFLVFLIQVADRIAHRQLSAEARFSFTSTLANRVAETLAENQSRLMGDSIAEHKKNFIDKLNQRAGEYADFNYGSDGPEFAFTRYLAFCMREVMDEKDIEWVVDQMMSIEAPEAVEMVEKTMKNLFDTEPRKPHTRKSVSGD
jgi:hypothetical protein